MGVSTLLCCFPDAFAAGSCRLPTKDQWTDTDCLRMLTSSLPLDICSSLTELQQLRLQQNLNRTLPNTTHASHGMSPSQLAYNMLFIGLNIPQKQNPISCRVKGVGTHVTMHGTKLVEVIHFIPIQPQTLKNIQAMPHVDALHPSLTLSLPKPFQNESVT